MTVYGNSGLIVLIAYCLHGPYNGSAPATCPVAQAGYVTQEKRSCKAQQGVCSMLANLKGYATEG